MSRCASPPLSLYNPGADSTNELCTISSIFLFLDVESFHQLHYFEAIDVLLVEKGREFDDLSYVP